MINDILSSAIPTDHSHQVHIKDFFKEIMREREDKARETLIDLGCGTGVYADFFSNFSNINYIGLDIVDSPESLARTRNDYKFITYDGVNIPCDDKSVNFIFMNQVLEHVQKPWLLFPEISRVLDNNGLLIGSVSQLEPYHSYSLFNFTYYGICYFCNLFDLEIFKLRPGIDGIQLINRTLNKFIINRHYQFEDLYSKHESPLNYMLSVYFQGYSNKKINLEKLRTAGQFCFAARKKNK